MSATLKLTHKAIGAEVRRRPYDLVVDNTGGFWFTDHGTSTPDHREYGAVHYARADGSAITLERGELPAPNGIGLSPDGMTVEAGGKVCIGTILNGGITIFDPDGTTDHVAFPELAITNLCFGGADMRDVWVTGSSSGRLYSTRWPRPGLKLAYNG